MERRTLLEKLGLIEKVENEVSEAEKTAKNTVQSPTDTEKFRDIYISKETEVKEKSEMKIETEVKVSEMTENPISVVRGKKLLKVSDIYKKYNINSEGINSLLIVESFQKALPDYLPTDVKRQSILNIIASSNVEVENLLKDGEEKLKSLNDFSESFTSETESVIAGFQEEIEKLKQKIDTFEEAIGDMKKLQNEQNYTIKYETEKINNILQFINPRQ